MKLLIAVALLVVGLSPCPGFSQFGEDSGQTTEAQTEALPDATTDAQTDVPTDTTADVLTDAPTDTTADVPTDVPTDTTADALTDAPTDTTAEVPTDAPTEEPTDAPTEEPTDGVPMCLSLSNPDNGAVSLSQGMIAGSVATYSCNTPYILNGNAQRTCGVVSGSGIIWAGIDPTCEFPTFNSASISYQLADYTVMEASSTQVCISIESGFIGSPFSIWFHHPLFGTITIWVHWDFPFGLVAGDLVCSALSAAEDDLRKNDRTLTIPLEIPVNVTGVSAVRNTAISLFLMDNDGPDVDECALGLDNCSPNAVCTNTVGGFSCTCNSGYNGDGVSCMGILAPGIAAEDYAVSFEKCGDTNLHEDQKAYCRINDYDVYTQLCELNIWYSPTACKVAKSWSATKNLLMKLLLKNSKLLN